jgi:hypothetical protein
MAGATYLIRGRVVERRRPGQPLRGIGGLRVEAWDLDTRYHDLLGQTTTAPDGSFSFRFDQDFFGDYAPDRFPDIFFRVLRGEQLLVTTQQSPLRNVRPPELTVAPIEVDLPAPRATKPDRLSPAKAFMAVDFVRQSNFKAAGQDLKAKVKAVGSLVTLGVASRLENLELRPYTGPRVRTDEVVGQDVQTATGSLGAKGVTVNEVKVYRPGSGETLRAITKLPVRLEPGDRVDLYQEDGRVRFYSIVRPTAPADINAADVADLQAEVTDLRAQVRDAQAVRSDLQEFQATQEQGREQLEAEVVDLRRQVADLEDVREQLRTMREQSTAKDQEIAALTREVSVLRGSQEQLQQQLSLDRIARLEDAVRRLSGPAEPDAGRTRTNRPPREPE